MIRDKIASGLRTLLGRSAEPSAPAAHHALSSTAPTPPPMDHDPVLAVLDPELVRTVIDEQVRPALQADGGDIELVEIRGGDVHVRLQGACRGCPGAGMTLRMGVEALLRDEVPGFGKVVDLG